MASGKKQIQSLARQFFKLSLVDGTLSGDRVTGILEYIEKHRPAHAVAVLKVYARLIAAEVARGQAVVEHAGSIGESALAQIGAAMTRKYVRPVVPVALRNDRLIAGLRVRVGDDVYESSVSGQLAQLATAV